MYKPVRLSEKDLENCNSIDACNLHCLLDKWTPKPLGPVLSCAVEHTVVAAGAEIFSIGENLRSIICITRGLVKVTDCSDSGCQRITLLAGPGYVIGLRALLEEPMRHDAHALWTTEICRVPVPLVRDLCKQFPEVYARIMFLWQRNLDFAERNITRFSTGPILQRLVSLLLYLSEIQGNGNESRPPMQTIRLPNRYDMASLMGVTMESVCRAVGQLKREKVLRQVKQDVYACDLSMIRTLGENLRRESK